MSRFDTVLVANRGEIALRIIATAKAMGLRTVGVYSDADIDARHVAEADQAVRIGPAAAAESYLSIPALLDAARRTGAGAVHPGYGFLSESAALARAVTSADLVFVGPGAAAMEAMGRKDSARKLALAAGLAVVPAAELDDLTDLDAVAEQVGFPMLAKAVAGGGGKGMRVVRSAADLPDAVAAARREALAAFGDDTMLFERFLPHGRHIEVQVLADDHGTVLHLFERDCSVQRRHQKVIEEAPASTISVALRAAVAEQAVALARSVGYVNAGTVEFLVAGEEAYFLEMNTRLQVEHPVTELITGLDLVALQLAVAQGERLPLSQDEVTVTGHAIEARVYAEDPAHDFLPQAGTAKLVRWPAAARIDAALVSGQVVGTHYDPMLGKVSVWGADRDAARRALVRALDETVVLGLTTNVGFLRDLADSAAFGAAAIDTSWLDDGRLVADGGVTHADRSAPDAVWLVAGLAVAAAVNRSAHPDDPLGGGRGWRLGGTPAGIRVTLSLEHTEPRVLTVHQAVRLVELDGRRISAAAMQPSGDVPRFEVEGVLHSASVLVEPLAVHVAHRGHTYVFGRPDESRATSAADAGEGSVHAPMPGTMHSVRVETGDSVAVGDTLGVLEAMKMELSLTAAVAGTVTDVSTTAGAQVERGALLFVISP